LQRQELQPTNDLGRTTTRLLRQLARLIDISQLNAKE
jgi:hypothetical protein